MPTYIARQKRTRVVYVVLLCVAIAMSTWAVFNQIHSDSTSAQFADQISAFCSDNPAYSNGHFNCQGGRGSDGAPAPQINSISFDGTPDDCTFVVTFTDNSHVSTPVRGDLCI